MQSSSVIISSSPPPSSLFHPFSSSKSSSFISNGRRRRIILSMAHNSKDNNYGGRMVDENMIVLRIRIHEMKMMMERNNHVAPCDWMEWEKHFYTSYEYESMVCEAMAVLQSVLMNTRPSLALGILAFLALSLSLSASLLLFHVHDLCKLVLPRINSS